MKYSKSILALFVVSLLLFGFVQLNSSELKIELGQDTTGWIYVREDSSLVDGEIVRQGCVFYVSSSLFSVNTNLVVARDGEVMADTSIKYFGANYYTSREDRNKSVINIEGKVKIIQFYIPTNGEMKYSGKFWRDRQNEKKYLRYSMKMGDSLIVSGFLK